MLTPRSLLTSTILAILATGCARSSDPVPPARATVARLAYVFGVADATGGLRAVASGADGYFYEAPSLVWIDRTPHLAVVGGMRGTGHFNADALYRWTPDAVRPLIKLDNESWRNTLANHLPPGFGVRKGVSFTYGDSTVTALTSLWRDSDGECCPTGGEARLFFGIEDNSLVLRSVERLEYRT